MVRFTFHHRRATRNIGDKSCCPADYFDFEQAERLDMSAPTPGSDVVVYGGGQIYRKIQEIHGQSHAAKVIWGVGMVSYRRRWLERRNISRNFALVGCRDYGVRGTTYVPCVSCLDKGFDAPETPKHDVVLYWHKRKSENLMIPEGIPSMNNEQDNLAATLAFIASGDTVVTNSYHGTYWAMLLGRKVLCLPYNEKFKGFQEMPTLANYQYWQGETKQAKRAKPHFLQECRMKNQEFYEKVIKLTG